MKKRILIGLLSLAMAGGVAGSAWALLPEQRIKTVCVNGTTATLTAVTIDNRILRLTCDDSAAGECGFYDAATAAAVTDTANAITAGMFADLRVIAGGSKDREYPNPRNITSGLVIWGKNATTTSCVEYQ